MPDPSEIAALQASFRGAVSTATSLQMLQQKIEGLAPGQDFSSEDLDELARITTAHAIASAALRGLVQTMVRRREDAGAG